MSETEHSALELKIAKFKARFVPTSAHRNQKLGIAA